MNTYLWHRAPSRDRDTILAWAHAGRYVTFPKRMFVAIPPILTDANVADLRAAYLRDRERAAFPATQTD